MMSIEMVRGHDQGRGLGLAIGVWLGVREG